MNDLSAAEILEERLSDKALKPGLTKRQLDAVFSLAKLATKTVLAAGAAGNVTCKSVSPEIIKLLKQLK